MCWSSTEFPPSDPSGALLRHKLPVTTVLQALAASFHRDVRRLRRSGPNPCREARQRAAGLEAQFAVRKHRRAADAAMLEWIAGPSGQLSIEDLALFKRNHPPSTPQEADCFARLARLLAGVLTQTGDAGHGMLQDVAGLHDDIVARMLDLGLLEPDSR